jgi:hypothetical protein
VVDFPIDPKLARVMEARSRSQTAFLHQSDAIAHLLGPAASPLVVTTGTGSGKTECFLLPVLENALRDVSRFQRQGLTAILVYPMNALANDQLQRIEDYLGAAGFGGAVSVRKYDRATSQAEREEMRRNPPHLLLTNYMMLEYLLVRPADRESIFANHRCRFMVLDEVHTYRGVLGSNIALLIRRLKVHLNRARQDWMPEVSETDRAARYPHLLSVGTSATIKSVAGQDLSAEEGARERDESVREFFGRLTGEAPESIRVVSEALQDITTPEDSAMVQSTPGSIPVDIGAAESVRRCLCALSGLDLSTPLPEAAARCRLLWLLNQLLVTAPMSLSQIVARVRVECPERADTDEAALRGEVEAALVAGAALPDDIPGVVKLRAHRIIRGGWRFMRCVSPACGRLYPMGEPSCACGARTAPLFLCRSCGADYLRFRGDPDTGILTPDSEGAEGDEWLIYDRVRLEVRGTGEPAEDDEDNPPAPRAPSGRRRIQQVRGRPVREGSFDPATLRFSANENDYPLRVQLVPGRGRCLCCGGSAGSRSVLTPVSLGTSAAVKVLSEGLVESLADANLDRPGHDGKERLLIFSDSRQDAAHQARFVIFASRYDRMRRRLVELLTVDGPMTLQRAVERLGELAVRHGDNPFAPENPEAWLSDDDRLKVRAWEEAPLLDELAITPAFRGTLINLGLASVAYHRLDDYVCERGEPLRQRWGLTEPQLSHLCRCFLDECRVRGMLSRELLRFHPAHPGYPDYLRAALWERRVKAPKALPLGPDGSPALSMDRAAAPVGITLNNAWRPTGGRGRSPVFQRLVESLVQRFGGHPSRTRTARCCCDSFLTADSWWRPS